MRLPRKGRDDPPSPSPGARRDRVKRCERVLRSARAPATADSGVGGVRLVGIRGEPWLGGGSAAGSSRLVSLIMEATHRPSL